MIKIKSIKLTDFGRHKNISQEFDGHVVGLSGPNGRGKSTVIQALQFALTGTIDHPDPLRSFIRLSDEAKPPKAAQVEVSFVADGKHGHITRRVTATSSSRSLKWDGVAAPLTSEKAVNELFFEILGVDKKAINSTVFIRQGEMTSMFGKDTGRRDFYTRLLMLGHLEKIANVVDTYRDAAAGSVQDLGAVKDAADAAYEEALVYWTQCKEEVEAHPDCGDALFIARKVCSIFEQLAQAEEKVSHAKARCGGICADKDYKTEIEKLKHAIKETSDAKTKLSNKKTAHISSVSLLRDSDRLYREALEVSRKYQELEAEEKSLAELGKSSASDVSEKLAAARKALTNVERLKQLELDLPKLEQKRNETQKYAEESQEQLDPIETAYADAQNEYSSVKDALSLRENIYADLQNNRANLSCECVVCGSKNPDENYLKNRIRQDKEALEKARNIGIEAREKLEAARKRRDNTAADAKEAKVLLDQLRTELVSLRMRSDNRSSEQIIECIKELENQQAKHIAWNAEFVRLTKAVEIKRSACAGLTALSADDLEKLARDLEKAQENATVNSWDESENQKERALNDQHKELQDKLQVAQQLENSLREAIHELNAKGMELDAAINQAGPSFFADVMSPGVLVLTVQEAQKKLDALQDLQRQRDEVTGRFSAADHSLKAASRRIDEVDLLIAEQNHRLVLVKDLAALRDAFKPNGASLDYLNYKFGKIAQLASDYLTESGADFMVAASETVPLAFEFLRTDRANEVWMPQNRMSGGQKVRLAVATLRAIHAMIMPNVGLLVLDEPTTHLDDEAKKSMADMLRKIGEEGALQMIVCDHSPVLIDAFSDTIQIPE